MKLDVDLLEYAFDGDLEAKGNWRLHEGKPHPYKAKVAKFPSKSSLGRLCKSSWTSQQIRWLKMVEETRLCRKQRCKARGSVDSFLFRRFDMIWFSIREFLVAPQPPCSPLKCKQWWCFWVGQMEVVKCLLVRGSTSRADFSECQQCRVRTRKVTLWILRTGRRNPETIWDILRPVLWSVMVFISTGGPWTVHAPGSHWKRSKFCRQRRAHSTSPGMLSRASCLVLSLIRNIWEARSSDSKLWKDKVNGPLHGSHVWLSCQRFEVLKLLFSFFVDLLGSGAVAFGAGQRSQDKGAGEPWRLGDGWLGDDVWRIWGATG